jgi:hypothetical protein
MHGREWVNISSYYVTTRTPQQCYTRFQAHRLLFRCLELCFNCFYVFIETLLELVFGVEIQTYLTTLLYELAFEFEIQSYLIWYQSRIKDYNVDI